MVSVQCLRSLLDGNGYVYHSSKRLYQRIRVIATRTQRHWAWLDVRNRNEGHIRPLIVHRDRLGCDRDGLPARGQHQHLVRRVYDLAVTDRCTAGPRIARPPPKPGGIHVIIHRYLNLAVQFVNGNLRATCQSVAQRKHRHTRLVVQEGEL